jgi:GPH family glycoside/pentoside/hexuronide:cation symporter
MSQKLTTREIIGYGLGDTAANLFLQMFNYYLMIYYTDVFGIQAATAGLIIIITRAWDTAIDPVMGILADRTKTQWGRFRPYMMWGAIPFGLAGILAFTTPDIGYDGKVVYAFITYSAVMLFFTIINTPYNALMAVLTPDINKRLKISSYKFVLAYLGGIIITLFAKDMIDGLGGGNEQHGYQYTAMIFGVVAILLTFLSFSVTRERVQPIPSQKSSIKQDLNDLIRNIPWLVLLIINVLVVASISMRQGASAYYFKYFVEQKELVLNFFGYTFQPDMVSAFNSTGHIAMMLGVILIGIFTKKIEKKRLYVVVMIIASLATFPFYYLQGSGIFVMFLLQFLINLTCGSTGVLVWAMYADIIDYSDWKNNRNATGLIFSASIMTQKLGWTVGGAMVGLLLQYFGFQANVIQSSSSINGIVLMMSILPAICTFAAGLLMILYKLDDQFMLTISKELEMRREKAFV